MKKLHLLVTAAACWFLSCSFTAFTFEKSYSGPIYTDYVHQTFDGGYIFSGTYYYEWYFLLKTDQFGDTLWTRYFHCGGYTYSCAQTADSGFILAGGDGGIPETMIIIKTDSLGNTEWSKQFLDVTALTKDRVYSITQTADGGYIFGGEQKNSVTQISSTFLVRTNAMGDTLWTRGFNNTSDPFERGNFVIQTHDGGFVLGMTNYFGGVKLLKTGANGDTLWTKGFSISSGNEVLSVIETPDNGFLVSGYGIGIFFLKTDSTGNTQWTKTYSGPGQTEGGRARQTFDGGFIVIGYTIVHDSINHFYNYTVKTDANGDTLWTRMQQTPSVGEDIEQTADSGYISIGDITGAVLVKSDEAGYNYCNDYRLVSTVTSVQTQQAFPAFQIIYPNIEGIPISVHDSSGLSVTTRCYSIASIHDWNLPGDLQVEISPNPFVSSLSLHFLDARQGQARLDIFNSVGQLVLSEQVAREDQTLNLAALQEGIYLIRIKTDEGIFTKKIVK